MTSATETGATPADPGDPDDQLDALADALDSVRRVWQRPADFRRLLAAVGEPIELGGLRVLRALERAKGEELSVSDVAHMLMVDPSTASRFVEQAASDGYVSRGPAAADRRRSRLSLTSSGERVLVRAAAARRARVERATRDWSPGEVRMLTQLLERLRRDVDRSTEGDPE